MMELSRAADLRAAVSHIMDALDIADKSLTEETRKNLREAIRELHRLAGLP
jgi:hypothetical protein